MENISPMSLENYRTNASNKSLNPNAAEFVPSSLRHTFPNPYANSSRTENSQTSGKTILDGSETNNSNNSDDEAHEFWHHQLPDDITPDFKSSAEDELSLAGLSISDGIETSRFNVSIASETFNTRHDKSPLGTSNLNIRGNMGYAWDKKFLNGDQRLSRGMEVQHYNGDSGASYVNAMLSDQVSLEDSAVDPVEMLATRFPGFSAESLAGVYYANGCDLNLTVEMLGQLEIQGSGNFNLNPNSKSFSVPSLSKLDIPSFPITESHNGHTRDVHPSPDAYRPISSIFRDVSDYSPTARKISPIDSNHWNIERNGSSDVNNGLSRSSYQLANSFNGHGKLFYGDKAPSPGASRSSPIWIGTEEADANTFSELREGARDLALLRDACLEQASQAYMNGNKVLARELSEKGHMYNLQMKAAQLKSGDTIYRKRDPISYELQSYGRGNQDRLIDLHGLHASDALHVLKHELSVLRNTAGATGHRLHATISLGGGPHSRGIRVSPRLPMAVEHFLLEEGLPYTQPQPGLLRVVIY